MLKRTGVLKEFGPEGLKVREEVAETPSLGRHGSSSGWKPNVFCLRIDADEYAREAFKAYYGMFEKHVKALTIFFNACSFSVAPGEILKCRDLGIDIQSHAFYHYTYMDYASNRYNIHKAKEFFSGIGIETTGFAAPLGRWNEGLARALEDEGYEYSSEFSYDYMAFPSYPMVGGERSKVLQLPVFPVAPELFFQESSCDAEAVLEYYKRAIDKMVEHGLPVIIYAHTHPAMPEIPSLLDAIADHAITKKGLKPVSMTGLYNDWVERKDGRSTAAGTADNMAVPGEDLLGRKVSRSEFEILKDALKNMVDFERTTPYEELKCAPVKKMLKAFARKVL